MENKKISPSVMCVSFFDLKESVKELEKAGTELLHVDVMDGLFVPNYTLGTDFIRQLKAHSNIPLDIHLMIDAPENKLDWFEFGDGDYVSVHAEACRHLNRALGMIRERGAKAMVAVNPATPINALESVLEDIDGVVVMTVNPGFAGQRLIRSTIGKITELRALLDSKGLYDVEIEVDGNVSFDNAVLMSRAGADIFVAGTSSVFDKSITVTEGVERLRKAIGK